MGAYYVKHVDNCHPLLILCSYMYHSDKTRTIGKVHGVSIIQTSSIMFLILHVQRTPLSLLVNRSQQVRTQLSIRGQQSETEGE